MTFYTLLPKYKFLNIFLIRCVLPIFLSTSTTLNTIEEAREKAARDAAYGVIDKIRLNYAEALYSQNDVEYSGTVDSTLDVAGTKPTSGSWSIDDNGDVYLFDVVFGEYACSGMGEGVSCSKSNK